MPRLRLSRTFALLAATSLGAIMVAYLLTPGTAGRMWAADLAWTWSATLAVTCGAIAARRAPSAAERRMWAWVVAGTSSWLLTQLVWDYSELVRNVTPRPAGQTGWPSLVMAIGYALIYPGFFLAVTRLVRSQPRRHLDTETLLDTALVTFTTAAFAYEYLVGTVDPDLIQGTGIGALLLPFGSVAVLWAILLQMLHQARLPSRMAGLAVAGMILFCIADLVYAPIFKHNWFASGQPADLLYDGGLLIIAVAAAFTIDEEAAATVPFPMLSGAATRTIAVLVGIGALTAIGIWGAMHPSDVGVTVGMVTVGGGILAIRLAYSIRADLSHAEHLEHEVARQTESLMDALSATAAAEHNVRALMESVPEAIIVLDRAGTILDLNPPARSLLHGAGQPGAGETPHTAFEYVDDEAGRLMRDNLTAAFHGEVCRFEVPIRREDGTRGIAALLYAPIRESGGVRRVLALARDVTDQRRTESQLQQADKLAALGQLVSGVAHEINNPAAIISGFAQTLLTDELKGDHRDIVQMIRDEAARIGRITSNLLAFARAGGRDRALVDVNDIVRRTYSLRSYHLSTLNIEVALQLDTGEPRVWGNGSELQQLLLNLMINAEQALTDATPPRSITLRTAATERHVRLDCIDTGPGIPPEIKAQIFDPFFTTKPEGVGTGLGLSICYGIARDHNGRIWVDSEPGAGAAFAVVLPRDPRSAPRAAGGADAAPPPTTTQLSVLLVDDEPGLRKVVTRFFTRCGIRTQAVGDGAEALEALRTREFDVILSDVRMPGVSGREFLERLRRDHPQMVSRLVFSTGDTFAPDTISLLKESGVPSVVKPFDFDRLERLVREVAALANAAKASA